MFQRKTYSSNHMLSKPLHCVKEHNLIWIAINNAPQNPSEVCRFGQSLSYEVGITIHKKNEI